MALTTDRISVLRGRPPMRAGGRRGFRTAHCWLVRSLGYGFGFIPFLRSRPPFGTDSECPPEKIAELMLDLQRQGCHNINFVTPEHVVPQVLEAIAAAIPRGLHLPIVYNTSAYDSVDSLRLLDGIVDIYMPDFKFWERETARR